MARAEPMIAEVLEEAYDHRGQRTSLPERRSHRCFHPTFPMGRFLSHPLSVTCHDLEDIRRFLRSCRYESDQTLFGQADYWQPPEEFERRKAGDCEDWALWTWRQLLALGFDARLVVGRSGRYGEGHAWLTFDLDGRHCLLEPQHAVLGPRFPRLATLRYYPEVSVAWDGSQVTYFTHDRRARAPSVPQVARLLAEWAMFWLRFWLRLLWLLLVGIARRFARLVFPAR